MNSIFLKLIQPFPLNSPFKIEDDDFADIKSNCLRHNLLMLVYTQLQRYQHIVSSTKSTNNFLAESRHLFLKNIAFSKLQETIEKKIVSLLREKDIPAIVIRGNEIAKEIYYSPHCRNSVDIDILIKRSDVNHANTILSEHGYVSDMPLEYWLARIHHAPYFHPETRLLVEVHWDLGVPFFFTLISKDIWKEVIYTDSEIARLSPEMLLIMLLIHHHSHSFRQLKILVDILWTLNKYEDRINWQLFTRKLKKCGLVKTTLITISQIQKLWGTTTKIMTSIQSLQQELKKTGLPAPGILISFFQFYPDKNNSQHPYKDKFLSRFVLDKWSIILLSFIRTLFPEPNAVKKLYRDKRNFFLPLNYLKFIMWRVKAWME